MNRQITRAGVVRAAAFLTALVMLLTAASCGGGAETDETSDNSSSLIELKGPAIPESLKQFLVCFSDWYEMEDDGRSYYDSEKAGDGSTNILRCIVGNMPCVEWEQYPVAKYEEVWDGKRLDPKKWAKATGGCYMVFDSEDADWIAVNIFNVSQDDLDAMRRQGQKEKWFYQYKGKYFTPAGGVGDPLTEYRLSSVKTDGTKYYVTYESRFLYDEPENADYDVSYNAELAVRTIDGKDYWTLYRYSRNPAE